ncbi:GumC family protein [Flavobacterium franklandianum]|uniref:non-specific protein-tyrosine kinase n=1 Tax=Flavobacterium franklandianum TaxID=2594430 RepID=A0A553C653_9FLAO|nr:tyrosine-protein kinase family protein [Flavobacterium franklandianum]TRX15882.1 polysaccharide biosynthesis tyrosine autokinase [Flavobacterium franklandianum]
MKDQLDFYEDEQEQNVFQNFAKYLYYWKWFVLSVLITISFTFSKLRYVNPEYKAISKIVVRDEKKGGLNSELSAFADMGLLTGMKNNVDNEIEILNSITLVEKAVESLKFTTTYFKMGSIRDIELYKTTQPFEFAIENASEVFYKTSQLFMVKILSASRFQLLNENEIILGDFNFGTPITLKEAKIKIQKLPSFNSKAIIGQLYIINFENIKKVGSIYSKVLTVEALSKTSSVVNLSISNTVPEKAEDFLNELVQIYNEEAIKDKNLISENTQDFIQKRLGVISYELGNVEVQSENFKKTNQLTDITANAGIYLKSHSEFETNLIETETQLRVLSIMIDFMKNKSKSELVPIDIVPKTTSTQTNPLIVEYNQLVLQRNRILKDGTLKNYVLSNLDEQLDELDRNIKESLAQLRSSLIVKRADLEKQDNVLQGKISNIPSQEREFRIFDRQQKIKEGVYLYLIQKREETAITLSVKEPNAKIIDAGRADMNPISPKKSILYLFALIVGIGIPFAVLFLFFMLDDKINGVEDVANKMGSIPVLAEIPFESNIRKSLSHTKEAFRALRNNTNFITPNNENKEGKVLYVSSAIKGEGKTFVSYNLAMAYAELNKKTILIGVDLRNPQLHKYLNKNLNDSKGISNYLHDPSQKWQDLILKSESNYNKAFHLDILTSGPIPPNPTLLLSSPRFETLLKELKKEYDFILIDTAPTVLVSDTLIISKFADTTLFVVRKGVTDKKLINYIFKLDKNEKLNNVGIVINCVDFSRSYGYNYGYGYGYDEVEKKLWYKKSVFRKLFSN